MAIKMTKLKKHTFTNINNCIDLLDKLLEVEKIEMYPITILSFQYGELKKLHKLFSKSQT